MISNEDRVKLADLVKEFALESDRGCAVLTICMLEEMLLDLIQARLPECDKSELRNMAPYGRLSASVDNAYLLGVLCERDRSEFKRLIKIRNLFAHRPLSNLSFANSEVVDMCNNLVLSDVFIEFRTENSRQRYMFSVIVLYLSMHHELNFRVKRIPLCESKGFQLTD